MKNGFIVTAVVVVLAFAGLAWANMMGMSSCCGGGAHHTCNLHHDQH